MNGEPLLLRWIVIANIVVSVLGVLVRSVDSEWSVVVTHGVVIALCVDWLIMHKALERTRR